jgi:DHA2 family multidrug resistance protein
MKVDPRKLIFTGVLWLGIMTLWRCISNTDMGFWEISIPLIFLGFGLPFFFIPLTGLALGSVEEKEMDLAAGLMNFLRTLSGAMATSYVATQWNNKTIENHEELVGIFDNDLSLRSAFESQGMSLDAINQAMDYMITTQSVMLATNQLMLILGITFVFAAFIIWLAPKPSRVVDPASSGH